MFSRKQKPNQLGCGISRITWSLSSSMSFGQRPIDWLNCRDYQPKIWKHGSSRRTSGSTVTSTVRDSATSLAQGISRASFVRSTLMARCVKGLTWTMSSTACTAWSSRRLIRVTFLTRGLSCGSQDSWLVALFSIRTLSKRNASAITIWRISCLGSASANHKTILKCWRTW